MRQRSRSIALVWLLAAPLMSAAVHAAGLVGVVTADGQTLASAWVQLNTGQIASTDARGRYAFPDLPQATYALQVFAPGREPVVLGGVVPGKGKADVALASAKAPLGLVHVTATTPDGAPCPVRLVTRWRAADGAEWQLPTELTLVSTLDARGRPLVPAAENRPFIVPFGACLWTRGEAVIALPPGQAELTCTAGVLMRASQQTVEVKPSEIAEVPVSMMRGSELGTLGWTNGALRVQVSGEGTDAPFLTNIPLAAGICRAEGFSWIALGEPYGNDPAQADPRQTAAQVSDERFAAWLAPELPQDSWAGRLVAVGQGQSLPSGLPNHCLSALLKRAVTLYTGALGPEPGLARELPFDLLADPRTVPLVDLQVSSSARDDYFRLWTLLLEHGLRLGCATVGDARLDLGRLPISERTFVRTDGKLDLVEVVSALQRGATFVTTGPALSFAVGDALPGDSLPADDQTHVAELDAVLGCAPGSGVSRLEMLRGGQVTRTWDVSDVGPNHVQARIAIREKDTTWYALRAWGTDPSQVACTSPVYFVDPAQPSPAAREARITGTVVDAATGAPVAGARIAATPPGERPASAVTGPDGQYALVASVSAMLEVSHPRYPKVNAPAVDVGARANATTKFVVWDCPELRQTLQSATSQDLLSWAFYKRLEEALAAPTVDFRLTPR